MSEAMTNREIEDVLTSIRRLVAQEGVRGADSGKLLLTEAQRVNGAPAPMIRSGFNPSDAGAGDEEFGGDDDFAFDPADYTAGPFSPRPEVIPAPDFGRLEATIAELEAAVSASGQGFEAESEGEGPRASNVTELYGRVNFVHRSAENLPVKPEPTAKPDAAPLAASAPSSVGASSVAVSPVTDPAVSAGPAASPDKTVVAPATGAANGAAATMPVSAETGTESAAETLAGDDSTADTVIDEAMLRQLIAQIVREELHGQLGERITHQVRKLVRAEIAKALDDRSFL